jgi:adenosylmethionine-8-amino-7-oxononanoate aminotransferase
MSRHRDLLQRDARHVWHPFTQASIAPAPLPVVRAKGSWLELADGRKLLDAISSWWTCNHGHSHPDIAAAISHQASTLDHVLLAGCTHPAVVELSERLAQIAPKGLQRVFYSDDGSTAIEVALKLAFKYWANIGRPEKKHFVALAHAYHGDTVGAMSAGDHGAFGGSYDSLLFPVERIHHGYNNSCPECVTASENPGLGLARLQTIFEKRGTEIAAMIMEPMVQGAGGMLIQEPEFLRGVRELCDAHEVLLIADEVMTGFGRTGKMFACEHAEISPDLLCLSKAITGGSLPLSATLVKENLWEAFLSQDKKRAFLHGHSYTGNPIACAAAVANLNIFASEPVFERIAGIEAVYEERLPALLDHEAVAEVRWLGTIGAVELKSDIKGYMSNKAATMATKFLEHGYLMRPLGPVLYTMPPYSTQSEELHALYDVFEKLLS